MAETNSQESSSERDAAFESSDYKPVVLTLKKRKKKSKRRYSKGLEEIQRMERHMTRSTQRLTRAMDKGVTSYRKRSLSSAKKKRDGALQDFIPNTGWAISEAMQEASALPYDLARAMDTKQARKRLRRQLRLASRTLQIWRF